MGPHEPIALWGAGHPFNSPSPPGSTSDVLARRLVTAAHRRKVFLDKHPEVSITRHFKEWTAEWVASEGDESEAWETHSRPTDDELMDYLEGRFNQH
jgi:hypothetical protein